MIYKLNKYQILEEFSQFIKDNWGKGALAAGGIAAANANVFGKEAQDITKKGLSKVSEFSKDSYTKMKNTYIGNDDKNHESGPLKKPESYNDSYALKNPEPVKDSAAPGLGFGKNDIHNQNNEVEVQPLTVNFGDNKEMADLKNALE